MLKVTKEEILNCSENSIEKKKKMLTRTEYCGRTHATSIFVCS
jgi:hypothetical protein